MLVAYSGMPTKEFIQQLRTYVIAMRLRPAVIDCVDDLTSKNDLEEDYTAGLERIELEAEERGRESMKHELIADVTRWLENQPNYELVAAPCEAIIAIMEKVEI